LRFDIKLNGRNIRPGDLAREFAKLAENVQAQAVEIGSERLRDEVAGLRCEEHGRFADVRHIDGDGQSRRFEIDACCANLQSRVQAQLSQSGAAASSAARAPTSSAIVNDVPKPPKAFISHATLDKPRIARPLDELLRARGVDVWLDERENLPGSNLVDQIFEQGIGKADVVIVVLSANSIDRPWVHAELTTAVVRQIEGKVKALIPILLDGVAPPVSLERLVQVRVTDLAELPRHAERIAATIFGLIPAPIASPPAYAGTPIYGLSGLTPDDERVFARACELLLTPGNQHPYVNFVELRAEALVLEMPADHIEESLAALENVHYFADVSHALGEGAYAAKISWWGFERYLTTYRAADYRAAKENVVSALVNGHTHACDMLAQELKVHEYIVDHILHDLERGGHVRLGGGGRAVMAERTLPRVLRALQAEK